MHHVMFKLLYDIFLIAHILSALIKYGEGAVKISSTILFYYIIYTSLNTFTHFVIVTFLKKKKTNKKLLT